MADHTPKHRRTTHAHPYDPSFDGPYPPRDARCTCWDEYGWVAALCPMHDPTEYASMPALGASRSRARHRRVVQTSQTGSRP